jgi:hypothetical protein
VANLTLVPRTCPMAGRCGMMQSAPLVVLLERSSAVRSRALGRARRVLHQRAGHAPVLLQEGDEVTLHAWVYWQDAPRFIPPAPTYIYIHADDGAVQRGPPVWVKPAAARGLYDRACHQFSFWRVGR